MLKIIFLMFSLKIFALDLKVGDILLQPMDCWSCYLIEAQEKSIYSHMGMVIEVAPEVKVVEALGSVRSVSLSDFQKRTKKGSQLSVRRLRRDEAVQFMEKNKEHLQKMFREDFEGLQYDEQFLWNNFDEKGLEKLYCSEMISKLLNGFMGIEIPLKKMKFDVYREYWIKYFKGLPPDDEPGNSPATFERSDFYYEVGKL